MFPIHEDALAAGTSKPLLFINSPLGVSVARERAENAATIKGT